MFGHKNKIHITEKDMQPEHEAVMDGKGMIAELSRKPELSRSEARFITAAFDATNDIVVQYIDKGHRLPSSEAFINGSKGYVKAVAHLAMVRGEKTDQKLLNGFGSHPDATKTVVLGAGGYRYSASDPNERPLVEDAAYHGLHMIDGIMEAHPEIVEQGNIPDILDTLATKYVSAQSEL